MAGLHDARTRYITNLYRVEAGLRSPIPARVAEARRTLATLRRGVVQGGQLQAYEVVFRSDPPDNATEQDVWLLLGGLFALHPLPWRTERKSRSIGASLGRLKKDSGSSAIDRRFTQLLSRDRQALPYHLRQIIRLLAAQQISIHYGQLLDDLAVLMGPEYREDAAGRVRLNWAREYQLMATVKSGRDSESSEESQEKN